MFQRQQVLVESENESVFLWGARQTGKSTLLDTLFPNALKFDLLLSDVYERLLKRPQYIREVIVSDSKINVVFIDEIQRLPELLNEVHWLIVNHKIRFILSGSSPRKIIRQGTNLLGGRALRYELFPLSFSEIPDFDILRAVNNGLLPRHYLSSNPKRLIGSYIDNYLRDEIVSEAKIRNVAVFAKFLEAAAFSNGEIVNFTNIATDCGVSSPTIKEYFQILQDTLLGRFIPVYQKKPKRRVIQSPKFYFFDIGIVNHLLKRSKIEWGTELFGNAFEQFIGMEFFAHRHYTGKEYAVSYWRTASQIEVDFILGDHEIAIEVNSSDNISERHLRGLKAFMEEYTVRQAIVVCNEPISRQMGDVLVLPWKLFLERLWNDEVI